MKTISPTLKAALSTGKRCFLLKITGKDGVDYGFTNHDKQLTYDGTVYQPTPGLKNLESFYTSSSEVSSSKFDLAFGTFVDVDEDLVRSGIFDDASYIVYRVAWDNLGAGAYEHDRGKLFSNNWDQVKMQIETQGIERDLNKAFNTINERKCRHQFGDDYSNTKPGACTLNLASYTYSSSVSSVTVQRMKVVISSTSQPDGSFTNGFLVWTSGDNNGLTTPIKLHEVNGTEVVTFATPTFLPVQVGDTFDITYGCDKTFEQCLEFNNEINFGGNPFQNPGVTRK